MTSLIFATLIVALGTLSVSASANHVWHDAYNYYWAEHCTFKRSDFSTKRISSWTECAALCKSDLKCSYFTWAPEQGGTCHLKNHHTLRPSSAVLQYGHICGYIKHDTDKTHRSIFWQDGYYFYWAKSCRLFLFDYNQVRARTGKDCAARCLSEFACTFYTWSPKSGGLCWLKNIKNYDENFSPSFADPLHHTECGFLKKYVDRPSVTDVFWYDHRSAFWSHDCDFRSRVVTTAATTFDGCIQKCTFHPHCTNFEWSPHDGGECVLKRNNRFSPLRVIRSAGKRCGFPKGSF